MTQFDERLRELFRQENDELPDHVRIRIAQILDELPEEPARAVSRRQGIRSRISRVPTDAEPPQAACFLGKQPRISRILAAAAAMLLIFITIPNVSTQAAAAMQELPVIGPLIDVVVLRNYFYDDSWHSANIHIPQIDLEEESIDGSSVLKDSVDQINTDVDELTSRLIREFEADVAQIGDQGHTEMDIFYRTVTNSSSWFTLEIQVYQGAGSGNTYYKLKLPTLKMGFAP